jgi:hypothetical protein
VVVAKIALAKRITPLALPYGLRGQRKMLMKLTYTLNLLATLPTQNPYMVLDLAMAL